MLRLLCNYSPVLLDMVRSREVHLDGFKLSREETFEQDLELIDGTRPAFLHWNHLPGREIDWARFGPWLRRTQQGAVNLHVMVAPDTPEDAWHQQVDDAIELFKHQVHTHLAAGVSIIIENVPYNGDGGPRYQLANAKYLAALCKRHNVAFLLDIAHARVAAANFEQSIHSYLSELPLEQVWEIHVNGPRVVHGRLKDQHEEMTEVDYDLTRWVLERTRAQQLTLEYGGTGEVFTHKTDPQALKRQLDRLHALVMSALVQQKGS